MAKTGYVTYWVKTTKGSVDTLRPIHQKMFPGNSVSTYGDSYKVAVKDGDPVPANAVMTKPTVPSEIPKIVVSGDK